MKMSENDNESPKNTINLDKLDDKVFTINPVKNLSN